MEKYRSRMLIGAEQVYIQTTNVNAKVNICRDHTAKEDESNSKEQGNLLNERDK